MSSSALMKIFFIPVSIILVLSCKPPEPFEPGTNRYRFTAVANKTATPGVISASVFVQDLDGMRFLGTKPFLVSVSAPGTGHGVSNDNSVTLTATMSLNSDGASTSWKAEIHKGDRLIASKAGSVIIGDSSSPKNSFP